jgi:hypothetical protein
MLEEVKKKNQQESFTQKVEDLKMKSSKASKQCQARINNVEPTEERITGRGGLSLFVEYLEQIGIFPLLESFFGGIRKSKKGLPVAEMFKQILCFFMDGTSRRLEYFDSLANDPGYAGTIQTKQRAMASSHAVKRFMKAFPFRLCWLFRLILLRLFLWRLHVNKPSMIVLGIDLVILDNDDAEQREQVRATYKKVKGFGALNMTWGNLVVDSILRSGEKHSNHSQSVHQMVKRVVKKIRKSYREDVPIFFRLDAGFFDQELLALFERLGVGYTLSGKLYQDIVQLMERTPQQQWQYYFASAAEEDERIWEYYEFGDRRDAWKHFRRAIFTRPMCDETGKVYLPMTRPCQVIYTNLGMGGYVDELLHKAGYGAHITAHSVIGLHHGRGDDELVFRAVKDFGGEILPFRRFAPNAVYYFCMMLTYFLFGCFKEDVCAGVISREAYPTTVRRQVIDIAAKVVRHAHSVVLKVTRPVWEELNFEALWNRCKSPPRIHLA